MNKIQYADFMQCLTYLNVAKREIDFIATYSEFGTQYSMGSPFIMHYCLLTGHKNVFNFQSWFFL